MKHFVLLLAAVMTFEPAHAQRHVIGEIDTETEEGKALQSIGTEEDAARKLQLMEAFTAKFGKHPANRWVLSQMQSAYATAGNHDKVIDTGAKLLALDPEDLAAAYANLKAAEARKDSAAILKWAVVTSDVARKTAVQPKGEDQEEADHKRSVDYAKQVELYAEYSLSANAATETNPALVMQLAEALEQRNPKSQYLEATFPRYAWAGRESKNMPAVLAFGQRALARNQMHEDLLLAMADYEMNQPKKDNDKVVLYSTKLVEYVSARPKPEGVSDTDWEKRRNTLIGVGNWMAGTTYSGQGKYAQADKTLRASLPHIKENEQLLAAALFHLGLANYQMGKGKSAQMMADAVQFTQQCAAIKGPFQAKAQSNLAVMRKETGRK